MQVTTPVWSIGAVLAVLVLVLAVVLAVIGKLSLVVAGLLILLALARLL